MNLENNTLKSINSEISWEWHKTFAGSLMQHNYYLYPIIDSIMIENPSIKAIFEIGTGNGALTTLLGLWGVSRNIPVTSIDHEKLHNEQIFHTLGIKFIQSDEFDEILINDLKMVLDCINGPVLFICDGGDKIKEFNLWAPYLKSGSIIAAHDWTTEIDYEGIESIAKRFCTPYREDRWNSLNVQFATFKITKPFLSIVTRNHPARQSLLERCLNSVKSQTDKDYDHVVIKDTLGLGIPYANRLFVANKHYVNGEYVFMLDDDDILISDNLVSDMKIIASGQNYPDIIFVLMSLDGVPYPSYEAWKSSTLRPTQVGTSCFVMRNHLWQDTIDEFKTTETPGDYNFINAAYQKAHTVYWQERMYSKADKLGGGVA